MDLAYWGFARWPFQSRRLTCLSPLGAAQEEAFARLLFLIDECRHYGLLTGAAGTGKSCLLQLAKAYSHRHGRHCIEIDVTGMCAPEFAQSIATQTQDGTDIGVDPLRCWSRIQQQLRGQALVNQATTVLIDHFDLSAEPLTSALRRLVNVSVQAGADVTVLIAARTAQQTAELHDELDLTVELTNWSADETSRFIVGSLQAAGAKTSIFSPDAVAAVHALAQGNPAQVVRICDLALLATMNDGQHEVDAAVVEATVAELSPSRIGRSGQVGPHQRIGARALV